MDLHRIARPRFAVSNGTRTLAKRHLSSLAIATTLALSIGQASAATAPSKCGANESARSDTQCEPENRTQANAPNAPVTVEAAKRAILAQLVEPGSAIFRDMRMSSRLDKEGRPYAVCGEVDMKTRQGVRVGYTKFYVPNDLEPLIVGGNGAGADAMSEALWQVVCARDDVKE